MEKLKGHGYPTPSTVGEVGQHYEDIDTGDIYECRIASKYSPTHGWPVGGYVWERRTKGEDIRDGLYGGSEPDMVITLACCVWKNSIEENEVTVTSGTVSEVSSKILAGEPVDVRVRGVDNSGGYIANSDEVKAYVTYYAGHLFVRWLSINSTGETIQSYKVTLDENGNVVGVREVEFHCVQ